MKLNMKRFKEIFNTGGWFVHVRRAFDSTCYYEGTIENVPQVYDDREVLMVMPYNEAQGDVSFTDKWQYLDVAIGD